MANCCDDYGQCTQGPNCPYRESPHDIAARHFWEPNQALRIDVYTGPSRLHRVLDWSGNQWDKLNELSRVCVAVFGVALCFAVAVAAVEAMT